MELEEPQFKKGIWPIIEKYQNNLNKFVTINKGLYKTVYPLFKPFNQDKLFCPIFEVYDSCLCSIGKKMIFSKEYGSPICSIKEEDIDKSNSKLSFVLALGDSCKSTLIFCKKCNKHSYEYYTKEIYLKTGEEAIYAHHIVKDVILPKFLFFLLEVNLKNDGSYIPGCKTAYLITPDIKIKDKKYNLVGGICTPTDNHFTAFIYNYQKNCFNLEYVNNYYYDGMNFNGGIIKENNILNYIIDKNPYLIIYKKNNI